MIFLSTNAPTSAGSRHLGFLPHIGISGFSVSSCCGRLLFPALALLVSTSKSFAAIEFIGSDTTAQVETVAGSKRTSGGQETLSNGVIRNTTFADVAENSLGEGRGSGSAEISVDPVGQPTDLFAFMQVAATALPQDNSGTFAEARVTYFFSNPIEIEVETGIRQGDSRFFIDSVQKSLTGAITRFQLEQGLHSFEIEAVPGDPVSNPNFSIRLFATDKDNPPPPPPVRPTIEERLDSNGDAIRTIAVKVTAANSAAQKAVLSKLGKDTSSAIRKVAAAAKKLSKSKRQGIATATAALSKALADFKKVATTDTKGRRTAKSNLLKANQRLLELIKLNL
jgi:hypothetical protein